MKITNCSWSNHHGNPWFYGPCERSAITWQLFAGGQEGPAASPEALRDAWPKLAGCSGPGWDPAVASQEIF